MISPTSDPKTYTLSAAERIHLDIYGYVIIESVLSQAEVDGIKDAMYAIEDDFRRTGEKPAETMFFSGTSENFFRIDNLPHLDSRFNDYVTKPEIVGFAEEAVGGSVRLEQSDAHIRRSTGEPPAERYGWHRGFDPAFAYRKQGLFHCPFVKCLTNLTDLGPDDGGTTVIAGSHKMAEVPQELIQQAVAERPNLRHQVVAPAGSTLLFFEATTHAGGINRSGKERLLILGGYTPDFFQPWMGYEPDPEFVAGLPEELRPFYTGGNKYRWTQMNRNLQDEV
jgi:ectoine hydroxylase-related dioxygenase (phytanoyl-CoA dioxygenase family)